MKTKNLIERLSLFLLALVLTMPTWAQGGSGNESETITIASKEDWKAFCQRVNKGQTTLNVKLTQDVDLGGEIVMVGNYDKMYSGTFDGQGHTLKFNWNRSDEGNLAPFWCVKDATIRNLRTQGKITTTSNQSSGMVLFVRGNTTITGCVSDVEITGGRSGLASSRAAGMVQAVAYGASVHITDCLVKGSITDNADEDDRAMAGFVFSNDGTYTLTRCLYVGTNNASYNGNCFTFGYDGFGGTFTLTDCYYLNPCGNVQGEQVTAERLKSGEMAKLLQGDRPEQVWGQTLGTDNEPLPTTDATKRVYEVKFNYNGHTFSRYANSGQGVHGGLPTAEELLGTGYNPHHYYAIAFADGFNASTPVNADRKVDITLAEKDCYEISTKEDWKAFCALVNGGQNAIDAKMTADVDLGTDIVMVGSYVHPYSGTFDGQNHTLKINWNSGNETDIAPFKSVEGATIKNLRTEGEINSNTHFLSGLICNVYGTTTISGCVSAVNITSSYNEGGCDAAGIIECVWNNANVTITDCVVKGKFHATTEQGQRYMAGFVRDQYAPCTLTNCLYAGTNNASGGYTFAPTNATLKNCYYLNACGEAQGTQVTKEQLKNGYVAHKLQGTREETVWGQVLGTDTIPQPTAEAAKRVYKVKFIYNGRVKATRYANHGGTVGSLPTAQEFLGEAYNPANTYKLIFDGDFSASTPVNSDRTIDVVVAESCEISSKADWQAFCNRVNGGETAINAKLMNDVDLGEEITMAGTSRNYNGTFDGQGHTLTLNWNSQSGEVAPFKFVNNATIKNLRVNGKIKSDGRTLSALVCNAVGNVTLSGCVSEVDITSNYHGVCELAGMIAYVNDRAEVAITDCVVKGAFNSMATDKKGMAGFVYLQTGYCTLTNCLYAGTNNATAGSYTFGSNTIRKNCYYLNPCGTAQGTPITAEQLRSGEITAKLQAGREDLFWGQTIGTDDEPLLTDKIEKRVYKVEFTYNGEVKATRYANSGGRVKLPTAKELLGADYDAQKSYTLTFENGFSETTAINGDITVSVTVNVVTGIDGVTDDNSTVRGAVYNLQGVRVAESSDAETLRRLPAGVYIVKGKKFVVR